jgi:LPXTG-site transpeptidase (sortase) family protein
MHEGKRDALARSRRGRKLVRGSCLCAALVCVLLPPAFAGDTDEPVRSGVEPNQDLIWIQDPWLGENLLTSVRHPDQSLWDPTQISDYAAALEEDFPPPLGVLTIPDLNIQVPIFNGADDHTLDRGAGRIKGMGRMDGVGNLGVSAHRDSFFRGLKDIVVGQEVLVQNTRGVDRYAVADIRIVPKNDVSALELTDDKRLTLVTCYPFYYAGHAPKRFIVTALPVESSGE